MGAVAYNVAPMARYRWLLFLSAVAGGVVFAAMATGQKVFVKSKNTRLLKAANIGSLTLATLQPGEEIVWQKKANEEFHEVVAGKQTGFVYFANLSLKKPVAEYLRGRTRLASVGGSWVAMFSVWKKRRPVAAPEDLPSSGMPLAMLSPVSPYAVTRSSKNRLTCRALRATSLTPFLLLSSSSSVSNGR